MFKTYADQDDAGKAAMKPKVQELINRVYEKFNIKLEGEMLTQMIGLYQKRVSKDVASKTLLAVNTNEISNVAYASIFATKASAENFLNNPDRIKIDGDKLRLLADGYINDQKLLAERFSVVDETFQKNTRLFLNGLMKSQPEKSFYPDANSTMRLTYGTVVTLPERGDRKYYGIDATDNYYTDVRGMVAKYKKGDEEFDLPKKFLNLMKKKDYGRYADSKTNQLQVNFLSDNDITGGNSGSPVMDADGNLIGLAFDGNSEALSGDIIFDPEWQRTISVDVRFVLWVIEKYGNAGHLINEMELVN